MDYNELFQFLINNIGLSIGIVMGIIGLLITVMIIKIKTVPIVPLKREIIEKLGGIVNLENLQYYVSSKMTLADAKYSTEQIIKKGTALYKTTQNHEVIVFRKTTPGIALSHVQDYQNRISIEISFENDNTISFKEDKEIDLFYITYNEKNLEKTYNRIKYGDKEYALHFEGSAPPYLLVRFDKREFHRTNKRAVQGRKIER